MNFTLAKYFQPFICTFSVLFGILYMSKVSAAPTTYALLNSFLQFLNRENCRMPSAVDLPFDTQLEETNPWNFLSAPLHICQTVNNDNSKVSYTLCTEIFDAVANISCGMNQSIELPNIKIKITTDVCQDFQKMENIFSVNADYIGKKLAADKVICSVICSGKEIEACKFLLWTYEVQKQINDYLNNMNNSNNLHHTSVIYNEIDSANLGPDEINKILGKDSNNSDIQEPDEIKTDMNHTDVENEANKQSSNEIIDEKQVENPSNDVVKDQKSDIGKENTQTSVKADTVDEDIVQKEGDKKDTLQDHNELEETRKELTEEEDSKVPDNGIAAKPIHKEDIKPSLADNEISKPDQDSNVEKNTSDFAASANVTSSTILGSSATKSLSQTITKITPLNIIDNKKQTLADKEGQGKDSKTKTSSGTTSESSVHSDTKAAIGAKTDVQLNQNENELPEGSDNKIVTDIPKLSEKEIFPKLPVADETENVIPDIPENSKPILNVDEFSNNLPEDDTDSLYGKKQPSALIPDANKDPKLSNEISNSIDKAEDKTDILLDREQEPNIDMESDFGENEFPSRDNGRSPVEHIQVIPMSQGIFPEQDDSHFFFYFLTIIFIVMAGYLIFHNKQKIIALIVEGRHERRRRSHGVGYKKLDTK